MQSQTSDFVSDSQVQSWNLNWIINRDHRCVNLNPLQVPSYLESDQNVWFRKACFVPILVVWSSLCSKSIKDNAKASGNFPGRRTEVWVHPRKTEFRARTVSLLLSAHLGPQTSLLIFGQTLSSKNSYFHISLGEDGTFVTWVPTFIFLADMIVITDYFWGCCL